MTNLWFKEAIVPKEVLYHRIVTYGSYIYYHSFTIILILCVCIAFPMQNMMIFHNNLIHYISIRRMVSFVTSGWPYTDLAGQLTPEKLGDF